MNAFLPFTVIQNILNEGISLEDLDLIIEDILNDPDFESSEIEIQTYDSIEELKFPNEYDGGIIILDDLNQKEMEDLEYKQCLKDPDTIICLSLSYPKIILNYQNELSEPMEIFITFLNQIIFVMFKIYIKTKLAWT